MWSGLEAPSSPGSRITCAMMMTSCPLEKEARFGSSAVFLCACPTQAIQPSKTVASREVNQARRGRLVRRIATPTIRTQNEIASHGEGRHVSFPRRIPELNASASQNIGARGCVSAAGLGEDTCSSVFAGRVESQCWRGLRSEIKSPDLEPVAVNAPNARRSRCEMFAGIDRRGALV